MKRLYRPLVPGVSFHRKATTAQHRYQSLCPLILAQMGKADMIPGIGQRMNQYLANGRCPRRYQSQSRHALPFPLAQTSDAVPGM